MKSPHIPALWVMLIIVVVRLAQSQTSSDELQKGVEAYKNARFEEALQHFKNVIAVDGGNLNGHLYLATALAQQYIPGADTPDNNKNGKEAVDEYQKVLELDSRNLPAVNSIAYLKLQMK